MSGESKKGVKKIEGKINDFYSEYAKILYKTTASTHGEGAI